MMLLYFWSKEIPELLRSETAGSRINPYFIATMEGGVP